MLKQKRNSSQSLDFLINTPIRINNGLLFDQSHPDSAFHHQQQLKRKLIKHWEHCRQQKIFYSRYWSIHEPISVFIHSLFLLAVKSIKYQNRKCRWFKSADCFFIYNLIRDFFDWWIWCLDTTKLFLSPAHLPVNEMLMWAELTAYLHLRFLSELICSADICLVWTFIVFDPKWNIRSVNDFCT